MTVASIPEPVIVELVKIVPSLLWAIIFAGVGIAALFYPPVRDAILPRVSKLSVLGVEISFIKENLAKAEEKGLNVGTPIEQDQVARRAARLQEVIQGARLLLVNDNPEDMDQVKRIVERLGVSVQVTRSTEEAIAELTHSTFDVAVSDMRRGENGIAGLQFIRKAYENSVLVPTILSVHRLELEKGVPALAFGITNRVDELLHLIFDALERTRG